MPTQDVAQPDIRRNQTRSLLTAGVAIVTFTALLAIIWTYASTVFLIFAGVLLGVFLNALTKQLGRVLPIPHSLRLVIVCLTLTAGLFGVVALGGNTIAQQATGLSETIKSQITYVKGFLEQQGIDTSLFMNDPENTNAEEAKPTVTHSRPSTGLPSAGTLATGGTAVLSQTLKIVIGALGAVGNFFIVIYLGLAFAAQPSLYRKGLLWAVPDKHHAKAEDIFDEISVKLERWLIAQMIIMAVVGTATWIGLMFIGVDSAFILGIQAGLLSFIPTIGAILGGIVVVLASLASGWQAAVAAMIIFVIIQSVESYILTPLMQKEAINIPPATLFATQIMLGTVFGLWGLALALPVMASFKAVVDNLKPKATVPAGEIGAA